VATSERREMRQRRGTERWVNGGAKGSEGSGKFGSVACVGLSTRVLALRGAFTTGGRNALAARARAERDPPAENGREPSGSKR
jgi:hypothetical protein